MKSLNSLDAAFVDAEDQDKHASFAIASVAVFEGPAPSYEEFLTAVAGRLPLYRRKLRKIPFNSARRSGWRPVISTSATTSGRPLCPRPGGTSSSAGWWPG